MMDIYEKDFDGADPAALTELQGEGDKIRKFMLFVSLYYSFHPSARKTLKHMLKEPDLMDLFIEVMEIEDERDAVILMGRFGGEEMKHHVNIYD